MSEDMTLAKKVRAMFNKLEEIREPYEDDWEDIAKYVFYRREFIDLDHEQGESIARDKYDGTPQQAATNLVHGFQGYMVSQSIDWMDLSFEDKELENYEEAMFWLEDLVHYFYEVFKETNFYDTVNDNLADAVAFGTPCFYSENDDKFGKIVYSERHPIEIYVAENRYGQVDTIFRKYKMSAREIVKQFDEKNISRVVKEDAEKPGRMYNEHLIIHGVFPNEDKVIGSMRGKDKPFRSVYIEEHSQDENIVLSDSGYDTNPYVVWRWDKNSTEWYGRSPSHNALPEILALNQIEKCLLEAVEKAVNPPMYVPGRHRGRLHLYPHGMNYYENFDNERIEMINQGLQLPIGMEERQDMRNKIRQYYFNDFFLILSQLMQDKSKTATEVLELQGEKAAVIAPIIGRFETRFLDPVIERTYQLEYEAGRLPEMPPVLEDYIRSENSKGINIRYTGPLATIQERLYKTTGVTHTLSSLVPMAELQLANAPILDKFDFDVMAEELARTQGFPQRAMRGDREVEAIRQARAEAQQAQQQMENLERASKAMPGMSKAIEKGSVLDKVEKSA